MIPAGYVKLVIHGSLAGGEIWETAIWGPAGSAVDQDSLQDYVNTAGDNFVSMLQSAVTALISADSAVLGIRGYLYTGGTTAANVAEYEGYTGSSGTGIGSLPDQCCLVSTLLTAAAGRRNRGRMYWPANGLSLASHQATATIVNNLADAVADFAGTFDPQAVVVSQVAGSARPVTAIRVDTKIDIQRRRANKQVATGSHTASVS
jgi:hypothetical protein